MDEGVDRAGRYMRLGERHGLLEYIGFVGMGRISGYLKRACST